MFGVFMVGWCLILSSVLGLCSSSKHVLNILILLEGLLLGVFCLVVCFCIGLDQTPMLILIAMSVCEAGIGLSLVVCMVRSHGNDYVLGLSSQKC